MALVYHNSPLGQLEASAEEAHAHKSPNVECCEQLAKSLEGGIRDDGSIINGG